MSKNANYPKDLYILQSVHLCSLTSFYSGILLDILDLSHLSMSDYDYTDRF